MMPLIGELVLDGAVTTNELPFTTHFADVS